jgi:hypothetical protein
MRQFMRFLYPATRLSPLWDRPVVFRTRLATGVALGYCESGFLTESTVQTLAADHYDTTVTSA